MSFVDIEFDHPGPKPSYGIAGYTTDGKASSSQHQLRSLLLPLDGSAPTNLTKGAGAKSEIRFRYVRDRAGHRRRRPAGGGGGGGGRGGAARARTIDLVEADHALGVRRVHEEGRLLRARQRRSCKELVYEDAAFSTPVKAAKADKYLFTRQTFVEFPDLRVSGPDFKDAKKISDANPQQAEYLWGHRVLFDFKDKDGHKLQGILALPDDYKPGEKRPMLVNFYEKNSQNMQSLLRAVVSHRHGLVADAGGERRLHHDAAGRLLPHRLVAQRHARLRSRRRRRR